MHKHVPQFGIILFPRCYCARLQRHPAFGAGPRPGLIHLRVHRAGVGRIRSLRGRSFLCLSLLETTPRIGAERLGAV